MDLALSPARARMGTIDTSKSPERRAGSRTPGERTRTDAALVTAMAFGLECGAERLFDRYGAKLYGLAFCMLNDHDAAESVVVETFSEASRDAESFDADSHAVAEWLLSLARRHSIERIRARTGTHAHSRGQPTVQQSRSAGAATRL